MPKNELKDSKSHKKIFETKKTNKTFDLAIIKTESNSPIKEIICRKEHKKLFEVFCEGKQQL